MSTTTADKVASESTIIQKKPINPARSKMRTSVGDDSNMMQMMAGSDQNSTNSQMLHLMNGNAPIQMKENEAADGDAPVSDTSVYYVTNDNAVVRSDTPPHKEKKPNTAKIPQGTKVKVTMKNSDYCKVEQLGVETPKTWWTSSSNITKADDFGDNDLYLAFYDNTPIYSAPFGKKSDKNLIAGKKYKIIKKCKDYVSVQLDGGEQISGWVLNYTYHLYKGATSTREENLSKYKKWLEQRYDEATQKTGDAQIKFIQGILGQVEKLSADMAKKTPVYPDLSTLDKNPSYSAESNPDIGAQVPHELIDIVRKFVELTELPVAATTDEGTSSDASEAVEGENNANNQVAENEQTTNESKAVPSVEQQAEQETENTENPSNENSTTQNSTENSSDTTIATLVGGSAHSNIDWNARLGVPQYRTQSDNLLGPEVTCSVTTMAMAMERLGNDRATVVKSIDDKLKEGVEKPDLDKLWKEKVEAYFKANTSSSLKNWQKLRGGTNGGIVGKEADVAKKFKAYAQYEDLIDFYFYLNNTKAHRTSLFSNTYNDKIAEGISGSSSAYKTERIDLSSKKLDAEYRHKMKETIDAGGSVVLSINHKGTAGSHIFHVQSITSEGIIVDDPLGGNAEAYRYGSKGDLFGGKGKKRSYTYKNKPHYNSTETDYTKRDFTAAAAQDLAADESKGKSQLIKYKMIDESNKGLFNYMVLYKKESKTSGN